MLKMVFLCRRRPDLTRERYAELVLRGHAPLALRHHPTLRGYVINVAEEDPADGPVYDSLPALYFDDLADYQERLYDSPEGERIVHEDVQGFMGGADAYATREQVHLQRRDHPSAPLAERTPGVKWVCPVRRRPGLSHAEFVEHWLGVHVPLVLRHRARFTRYATSVVDARLSPTGDDWDGFTELAFATPDDARAFRAGEHPGAAEVASDAERFVGRELCYPVSEYVQRWPSGRMAP